MSNRDTYNSSISITCLPESVAWSIGNSIDSLNSIMPGPVKVPKRRSSMASSASSDETFLSAGSPFELPYVPTSPKNSMKREDSDRLRCIPRSSIKIIEVHANGQVSLLSKALDCLTEQERLVSRRQLLRKSRMIKSDHESIQISSLYPVNKTMQSKSYDYTPVTSW